MNDLPDHQNGEASHRGGFGDFAGETTGLIDRSFREQIVLVAVQFPGFSSDQVDANLDELAQLVLVRAREALDLLPALEEHEGRHGRDAWRKFSTIKRRCTLQVNVD